MNFLGRRMASFDAVSNTLFYDFLEIYKITMSLVQGPGAADLTFWEKTTRQIWETVLLKE